MLIASSICNTILVSQIIRLWVLLRIIIYQRIKTSLNTTHHLSPLSPLSPPISTQRSYLASPRTPHLRITSRVRRHHALCKQTTHKPTASFSRSVSRLVSKCKHIFRSMGRKGTLNP